MDMISIRRKLMAKMQSGGGRLPDAYQEVEYLYRSSAESGPASAIYVPIVQGDIITTGTKVTAGLSGERAFAGDASKIDWYYNSGSLMTWASGNYLETIDTTYGEPDVLTVRAKAENTIRYIGIYRYGAYRFNGRIYFMTIKDSNGIQKYNYVPCYRKSDNEAGFYETVNHVFYPNTAISGQYSGVWEIPT